MKSYSCCRRCDACAGEETLEVVALPDQLTLTWRPAAELRSIEDLLFLSLGPQGIVITVVILTVTMESYETLVYFLNSHLTHMELLSEGEMSPQVSCSPPGQLTLSVVGPSLG